ncbi:MAG: cytochrome P450 [Pseudomonadota bacterium]
MAEIKLFGEGYKRAPFDTLRTLIADGPVTQTPIPIIGKARMAVTHGAALTVLKDTDRFCVDARNAGKRSQMGIPFLPKRLRLLANNMLGHDDPEHRRLRRMADGPFLKPRIESLAPTVEREVAALLDELEGQPGADLVTHLARPLPLIVICELLGLPREDRVRLTRWIEVFSRVEDIRSVVRLWPTLGRLIDYLRADFATVRKTPRPGLISELIHDPEGGDTLSDDELLSMVFMLFIAGHETTTHLISSAVWTLLGDAAQREAFTSGAMPIDHAVEELLRYCAPVRSSKPRMARQDTELMGVPIRRGERVFAYLAAANMDGAVFDDPFTLNLSRNPNRHMTFGSGPHICLGLHLARLEGAVALKALFERWPGLKPAQDLMAMPWGPRYGVRGLASVPVSLQR